VIVIFLGIFVMINLFLVILICNFDTDPPQELLDKMLAMAMPPPGDDDDDDDAQEAVPVASDGAGGAEAEKEEVDEDTKADNETIRIQQKIAVNQKKAKKKLEEEGPERIKVQGTSCGMWGPEDEFRLRLAEVVETLWFQNLILGAIMISSVILTIDVPAATLSSEARLVILVLDIVFTALFVVEMAMKMIVQGVWYTPKPYFSDPWNDLDFIVVIVSVVSLIPNGPASLNFLKSLRTLRALRPLASIKRAPGLKIVVEVLFVCGPVFINISLVCFVFYLVFAILGVNLYGGKFWRCNDTTVAGVDECWGEYLDDETGEMAKRKWINGIQTFDSVPLGLLTLFETSTIQYWLDPLYAAMDSTDIGKQPIKDNNPLAAIFFLIFIVIGAFFVLNLFVGAVIDTFNKIKKNSGRFAMVTPAQENFIASVRMMLTFKPPARPTFDIPKGARFRKLRNVAFHIVTFDMAGERSGAGFDNVIMGLVILNAVVFAGHAYPDLPSDKYLPAFSYEAHTWDDGYFANDYLQYLNALLLLCFSLEFALRVMALGWSQVIFENWHKFDLFLVVMGCGELAHFLTSFGGRSWLQWRIVLRFFRELRALRLIRLVKWLEGVMVLLRVVMLALPGVLNVAGLMFLVLFIYAVLGMNFFGLMRTDLADTPFGVYSDQVSCCFL